jgi:hypothetical protein
MRSKILTIFILLFHFCVFSQERLSFDVNLRYGIPTDKLVIQQPNFITQVFYNDPYSLYDRGLNFRINYLLFNKTKNSFYCNTGFGAFNSGYVFNYISINGPFLYQRVEMKVLNYELNFGFEYEREIYDDKFYIGVGYSFNHNFAHRKYHNYNEIFLSPSGAYHLYDITLKHKPLNNHLMFLTSKYRLAPKLLLTTSVGFLSLKKVGYRYSQESKNLILSYDSNGNLINSYFDYNSINYDFGLGVKNSFLTFAIGFNYKL